MDNKTLKINAEKKLETTKPATNLPANKITIALITNRNRPKLKIVAGNVKRINRGLTNMFKRAIAKATQIAVEKLSTKIPGKIFDNTSTTTEVSINFNKKFIFIDLKLLLL